MSEPALRKGRSSWPALLSTVTVLTPIIMSSCAQTEDASGSGDMNRGAGSAEELQGSTASLVDTPHVVTVAHGAALLADGRWVDALTPELVRKTQAHYLATLQGQASSVVQAKLEAKQAAAGAALQGADSADETAKLIDFLIAEVKPEGASRLAQINGFVRAHAVRPAAKAGNDQIGVAQQALATSNSGQAYKDQCAAAGVPNPPNWGSSGWQFRGALTTKFIIPDKIAEVYTYTSSSPRGVCIALPRRTGNVIDLIGIICQGNDTSKTCFWDTPLGMNINVGETFAIPSAKQIGGAVLAGNGQGVCTDCHAGENNFIIHPDNTAMQLGDSLLRAKGWVAPLVTAGWPQNPRPGKDLQRIVVPAAQSCLGCHNKSNGKRFPRGRDLSDYCLIVGTSAVSGPPLGTMPQGNPGNVSAYSSHANAIRNMCGTEKALGTKFAASSVWHNFYAPGTELPMLGDFNGDGRSDIITFTLDSRGDAIVALSSGAGFGTGTVWHNWFGRPGEQLKVGDFNGDGRDDIVVFPGNGPALVATSSGSGFSATGNWGGLVVSGTVAATGDFNNDRYDDIVVFTKGNTNDALVGLSNGSSSFGNMLKWHDWFAPGSEIPLVGDFNGDSQDDIVTFTGGTEADVWVALSNGNSFAPSSVWQSYFAPSPEVPRVGDVNGDGLDDIISFVRGSAGDVWVALSNGSSFGAQQKWHDWMGINNELPYVGDVDGDSRDDAVVFLQGQEADVYVAKSAP